MIRIKSNSALILVDIQNDFCPGGSLAVRGGDDVIAIANSLQQEFPITIATKDWHPTNHTSFASNHLGKKIGDVIKVHGIDQILWPDHCIQNTHGAEFHLQLNTQNIQKIFYKGTNPEIDSYSAFFDNEHRRATRLGDYLHDINIKNVYIMGLATDYCVKYSCLDAVQLGFHTHIIQEGCRGVELHPGDIEKTLQELKNNNIELLFFN